MTHSPCPSGCVICLNADPFTVVSRSSSLYIQSKHSRISPPPIVRAITNKEIATDEQKFGADNDNNDVVDRAKLLADDAWEEHHFTSSYLELNSEEDKKYRTPSHSYVSHLVRDMNDKELDAFLLEASSPYYFPPHDSQPTNEKQKQQQAKQLPNQTTQLQLQLQKQKPPDTYIYEPYRQLRLLRRRITDPLWSQIRLEAQR